MDIQDKFYEIAGKFIRVEEKLMALQIQIEELKNKGKCKTCGRELPK